MLVFIIIIIFTIIIIVDSTILLLITIILKLQSNLMNNRYDAFDNDHYDDYHDEF